MGLFEGLSGVRSRGETSLGPAEAFAAITLISVASDGYLADEESRAVANTLTRMKLFRSYPADVTGRMFDRLCSLLKRQGYESLLKSAISSLPHDLYETAFAVATDLVLADGEVTEDEEAFLIHLYQLLEISDHTARTIIDVLIIKNRG